MNAAVSTPELARLSAVIVVVLVSVSIERPVNKITPVSVDEKPK